MGKKKIQLLILLSFLCIFGLLALTNENNVNRSFIQSNNEYNENNRQIKTSSQYIRNPFVIDDNGDDGDGGGNWTWDQAISEDWCSKIGDVYVIENVIINGKNESSCLTIRDSKKYFIVRNCILYNSSDNEYNAGILLDGAYNGTLIKNNCSYNNQNGISLLNSKNNTLYNNTVKNNKIYGLHLKNSDECDIIKNNVSRNVYHGVYLESSNQAEIINNSFSYSFNGYGIYSDGIENVISQNTINNNTKGIYSAQKSIITNNEFQNEGDGVGIDLPSGSCDNNIANNEFLNCSAPIVMNWDCENNTISNNTIINFDTSAILIENDCFDNKITNNTIKERNKPASFSVNYGIHLRFNCDNNSIISNDVSDCAGSGIRTTNGCDNNTIRANRLFNNYQGIAIGDVCNDSLIIGNNISRSEQNGIVLSNCNYINITGNTINHNGEYGIELDSSNGTYIIGNVLNSNVLGNTSQTNVKDNHFKWNVIDWTSEKMIIDNNGDGDITWKKANNILMWVSGSGTPQSPYIIKDIIFNGHKNGDALMIRDSFVYFKLLNCTFINGSSTINRAGLRLSNANNGIIENCSFIDNLYDGLRLESADNHRIHNCTSLRSTSVGIRVENSNNNNFTQCLTKFTGVNGFTLTNSNNTILNSLNIETNEDDGLVISTCFNDTIINCYIYNNSGKGIYLLNSDNNTIKFCNIYNNSNSGFHLHNSNNNNITCNNFTHNGGNGIRHYESGNNNIINNNITHNGKFNYPNIYIYDSDFILLSNNNISFNEHANQNGIYILLCRNVTVKYNYIASNTQKGIYESTSNSSVYYKNIIQNNDNTAVDFLNSKFLNFSKNTIIGNGDHGLLLRGTPGCLHSKIILNNISNNGGAGMYGLYLINSNSSYVFGNRFSNNGDGWRYTENTEDNTFLINYYQGVWSRIGIDNNGGSSGNFFWEEINQNFDWCSGSGTFDDPYIIEGIMVNGTYKNCGIGIRDYTDGYFIIQNCTIMNGSGNINGYGGGLYLGNVKNGKIINNNCTLNVMHGMYIESVSNITIHGNDFINNGHGGIRLYGNVENITISNNNCSQNSNDGLLINGLNPFNITIKNNILNNNGESGIEITNGEKCRIRNNTISYNLNGIQLKSGADEISIENNTFYKNYRGLQLQSLEPSNKICFNRILNSTFHGIELMFWTLENNTITHNLISGNEGWGIVVRGINNTLSYNEILYNDLGGIVLTDSANNTHILNNNITFNEGNGIYLNTGSSNNTLSFNRIINNTDQGICLIEENNWNHIHHNIICNSTNENIYLSDSNNNTIMWNVVNYSKLSSGIHLYRSSNNTISKNSVNLNGDGNECEIYISSWGHGNKILQNNCTIGGTGIRLQGGLFNIISRNFLVDYTSPYYACISVGSSSSHANHTEISYNIIRGGADGITVANWHNKIFRNNLTNIGSEGIRIDVTYGEIYENNISRSYSHGLMIQGANHSSIWGNLIISCGLSNYDGIYMEGYSQENIIYKNQIIDSVDDGIEISTAGCRENIFYNNIIWNSGDQNAIDINGQNHWNYSGIGNNWSDYSGHDLNDDYIGETPYNITGHDKAADFFPIFDDGDNLGPQITLYSLENLTYWNNATKLRPIIHDERSTTDDIWYTIIGNNTLFVLLNDTINYLDLFIWLNFDQGEFLIIIHANDSLGNENNVSYLLYKDTIIPILNVHTPADGSSWTSRAPINITVFDANYQDMWYRVEGNGTNIYLVNSTLEYIDLFIWNSLEGGSFSIKFFATDLGGNLRVISYTLTKIIPATEVEELEIATFWILEPLIIDDLGNGDYTWRQALNQPWCSGAGTHSDPYIIENITITWDDHDTFYCLLIRNSEVYFIIRNCNFSSSEMTLSSSSLELSTKIKNNVSGIFLQYVENARIYEVNCSGLEYGMHLVRSNNNTILLNIISYNNYGIYLKQSNNNIITKNILIGNEYGIKDMGGKDNIITENDDDSKKTDNVDLTFIIIIIIIVGAVAGVGGTSGYSVIKKKGKKEKGQMKDKLLKEKLDEFSEDKLIKMKEKATEKRKKLLKNSELKRDNKEMIEKEKKMSLQEKAEEETDKIRSVKSIDEKPEKPKEVKPIKKIHKKSVQPKKIKKSIEERQEVIEIDEEKKEELKKTEDEMEIEKKEFTCVVHKGAVGGANIYLCTECHTIYCTKCAKFLKDSGENCWSCDSEISL